MLETATTGFLRARERPPRKYALPTLAPLTQAKTHFERNIVSAGRKTDHCGNEPCEYSTAALDCGNTFGAKVMRKIMHLSMLR
jgi:hypothetical protein